MPLAFTSASSLFMVCLGPRLLLSVINPSAAIACTLRKKLNALNPRHHLVMRVSRPPIDQPGKERGIYDKLPPFRVEVGGRLSGYGLADRSPLLLEHSDVVADCDQHFAECLQLGSVAHRWTVPRD